MLPAALLPMPYTLDCPGRCHPGRGSRFEVQVELLTDQERLLKGREEVVALREMDGLAMSAKKKELWKRKREVAGLKMTSSGRAKAVVNRAPGVSRLVVVAVHCHRRRVVLGMLIPLRRQASRTDVAQAGG